MRQPVLTAHQLATFDFVRGACKFMGKPSLTPDPQSLTKTIEDLGKVQGSALIVGGVAVIHYGYERSTTDVDILYAHADGKILERLKEYFKIVLKAKNGWHHLEHRRTGVRLELIPEGGLTTYGFIPGPKLVGGTDHVISLHGLVWLKLVSGRMKDLADLETLARVRMSDMRSICAMLPPELQERYDQLLTQTKKGMENDPSVLGGAEEIHEPAGAYRKTLRKKRLKARA